MDELNSRINHINELIKIAVDQTVPVSQEEQKQQPKAYSLSMRTLTEGKKRTFENTNDEKINNIQQEIERQQTENGNALNKLYQLLSALKPLQIRVTSREELS